MSTACFKVKTQRRCEILQISAQKAIAYDLFFIDYLLYILRHDLLYGVYFVIYFRWLEECMIYLPLFEWAARNSKTGTL